MSLEAAYKRFPHRMSGKDYRPYPTGHTVHSLFREQVVRRPCAVAVEDGEARLTYSELDERANQLAHYLRDAGVQPGQPVAVCMDRSIEFVITVLAILKAGGVYVPLSPDLPPRRIRFILENIAPPLLITHRNPRHGLGYAGSWPFSDSTPIDRPGLLVQKLLLPMWLHRRVWPVSSSPQGPRADRRGWKSFIRG